MSKRASVMGYLGGFSSSTRLILITFCLLLGDVLSNDEFNHDQQAHVVAVHHHHHHNVAQKPPFSPNQSLINKPNRTG